jgi:hypothetical protein
MDGWIVLLWWPIVLGVELASAFFGRIRRRPAVTLSVSGPAAPEPAAASVQPPLGDGLGAPSATATPEPVLAPAAAAIDPDRDRLDTLIELARAGEQQTLAELASCLGMTEEQLALLHETARRAAVAPPDGRRLAL